MSSILILLLFLLIGYGLQKIMPKVSQELWSDRLSSFVVNISLPALVMVYMIDLKLEAKFIVPVISAWGLFALAVGVVLILGKILQWRRSVIGASMLLLAFGNTSFLGIPFTLAFFGEEGVPYAIIYDQLGSFIILATLGLVILSLYSSTQSSWQQILYRIFTFPSFVALLGSLVLESEMLPLWIMSLFQLLAITLTPLALVSIGLRVKLKLEKEKMQIMGIILVLKLILFPLFLLFVLRLLSIDDFVAQVTVFEAGMAPMVSAVIFAIRAGMEKEFVSSVLGYGIVLSFVSLPLLYWLMQSLFST